VCPVNWKEGDQTIKADPKGSLEYFSTANDAAFAAHGDLNGVTITKRPRVAS
jgi:hypothetical protein